MATKRISLNELRTLVKQIIKESDLGDVYAAYSNANEPEYPSKVENLISQLERDGLFSELDNLNDKRNKLSNEMSDLLTPIFNKFINLGRKLKKENAIKNSQEAEEFIGGLLQGRYFSILSKGNKDYLKERFISIF
jgi:hypothetical protein